MVGGLPPEKRGKPGEAFERLPEEQKAILRNLKSSDIDVRFEAIRNYL